MNLLRSSRLILSCLAISLLCNRVGAALFYDFVEWESGNVLATLQLSSLPASHWEVLGLTFTPAGQAKFGYGPIYQGEFDDSYNWFVDDGSGGIGYAQFGPHEYWARIVDHNPPPSSFGTPWIVSLSASIGSDEILIHPIGSGPEDSIVHGQWLLIPEPTSASISLATILFAIGLRRRHLH